MIGLTVAALLILYLFLAEELMQKVPNSCWECPWCHGEVMGDACPWCQHPRPVS